MIRGLRPCSPEEEEKENTTKRTSSYCKSLLRHLCKASRSQITFYKAQMQPVISIQSASSGPESVTPLPICNNLCVLARVGQ